MVSYSVHSFTVGPRRAGQMVQSWFREGHCPRFRQTQNWHSKDLDFFHTLPPSAVRPPAGHCLSPVWALIYELRMLEDLGLHSNSGWGWQKEQWLAGARMCKAACLPKRMRSKWWLNQPWGVLLPGSPYPLKGWLELPVRQSKLSPEETKWTPQSSVPKQRSPSHGDRLAPEPQMEAVEVQKHSAQ